MTKRPQAPLKWEILAFILLGWFLSYPSIVTGQEILFLQKVAWDVPEPGLSFGVDKIANTFVFTGNAMVEQPLLTGTLQFSNRYRGSAFRTTTMAIRDDETATLFADNPLVSDVFGNRLLGIFRSSWILSRDNRSIGLSSLQRINGVVGLRYEMPYLLTSEVFAGIEQTTQLGVAAGGPIVGASATMDGLSVEELQISSNVLADWHRIDSLRTNADVSVNITAAHEQDNGSHLRLGLGGLGLQREYLTTLMGTSTPDAVEGRVEKRFDGTMDVQYRITPQLLVGTNGFVNVNGISRQYAAAMANIPITAVQRQLEEFVLNIEGMAAISLPKADMLFMATLYRRTEENTVNDRFPINPSDLSELANQEFQRDNRASRVRLYAKGAWRVSDADTLSAEYTWWLLQYDTPSSANNDDRDELSAIATVRYARHVSERLSVGISVGAQYLHTVYLKALRSGFNNQNNVIRMSPFVRIVTNGFSMHPQLEVLANYTVYDFESGTAQARSYSYRQLSYRDSVRVHLSGNLRVEVPALVRYFERSTLLWQDFAEIRQAGNLEYLVNTRIFAQPSFIWDVGVGIRWYAFEQRSLVVTPGLPSVLGKINSWAPEVVVRYYPGNGSTLDVGGWYEFQTLLGNATRELPNLLLTARIAL